jgi:hypothetical protein
MSETRIKFSNIVENQLPEYIKEEFPLFSEFLTQYYISNEYQGSPADLIQNIDRYTKIDNSAENVSDVILKEDISFLDEVITVDLEKNPTGTQGFPKSYGLLQIDDEIITYKETSQDSFIGCVRGFSGIVSYEAEGSSDEVLFKTSLSDTHKSGSKIINLSVLFLNEFLKKTKYQLLPGFEEKNLYSAVNEKLFIKQGHDFYSSKGTDESFNILFKCLYGQSVKIIRPKDYLFKPSDAQYNVTYDFVVESIDGNPLDLVNSTLYQDEYEYGNYAKSYAPITSVETLITKSGEKYYKLSVDAGYSRDISVDGSVYGEFSIHPKTKVIDDHSELSDVITVDSTLGFPKNGHLSVEYTDGTSGIVSYTSKSVNQFYGCFSVNGSSIGSISNGSKVSINTFAYGSSLNSEVIKVKINSILNQVELKNNPDNFYHNPNTKISVKSLGFNEDNNFAFNNWIFNTSPTYNNCSVELTNSQEKKYTITTKSNNIIRKGDFVEIKNINSNVKVDEVFNKTSFSIKGIDLSPNVLYSIRRKISKVNIQSSKYSNLLKISSDVQNIYEKDNQLIVATNSLPKYEDLPLSTNDFSVTGNFIGISTIQIEGGHYFESGDIVYFTPANNEKAQNLLEEGIYFVNRQNDTQINLGKSRSSIYKSDFVELNLDENSTYDDADGCKIEFFNFASKSLNAQKLLRVIPTPTNDSNDYESFPGAIGILINGTEIFNYKSTDKIYYGQIESIEILSSENDYDVINPPILKVEDSLGSGVSGYCSVEGILADIEVIDPGFDYVETPIISITGGNGTGANAVANIKLVDHEVLFDAQKNVTTGNSTASKIGFSTYHKFRNGERVIYKTNGYSSVGGISTNASYYVSVKSPTEIQLHSNIEQFNSGIAISFTSLGVGEHKILAYDKKITVGSISIIDPGSGYQNKKRTTSSSGISTFSGYGAIFIENHGYESGEILKYSVEGTAISGLSTNKEYFITKLNEDRFTLSEVGVGITEKDFYYKSAQYIKFNSVGVGTHIFNYPEINVSVIGEIGVSTVGGSITKDVFKSRVNPKFRGKVSSIHLNNKGTNYGSPDILNFNRLPEISLESGSGAVLSPIIKEGRIVDVSIISSGQDYNSSPVISVIGDGIGAVLNPIVSGGSIISVKVIESGFGYSQSGTQITVLANGSGAKLYPKIQTWTINLVERFLKSFSQLDDGALFKSISKEDELQYGHLYYPRKFKEILNDNTNPNILSHSPLIGWAYDGNPIYGPYGYNKKNGSGGIVQLNSGYLLKTSAQNNRPEFPLGFFIEDYEYKNKNDENCLDEYNGRFCITPEFPLGVYAYFSTLDLTTSSEFNGYKKPKFPYFVGNFYRSKPNGFNFVSGSTQEKLDLNEIECLRNTNSYGLDDKNIIYEYLNTQDYKIQFSEVKSISPGYIEKVEILNSGENYRVGDNIIFDNQGTSGYNAAAKVSKVFGKAIQNISVTTTSVSNVEFYPDFRNNSFLGIFKDPHQFKDDEVVTISGLSTTTYTFDGLHLIEVPSNFLVLRENVGSVSSTGIVTYFSVSGNIDNFKSNDILGIGTEKVRVLNADNLSSRIRVLRSVYGTVGSAHSALEVLEEKSRKIIFQNQYSPKFEYKLNDELYFNPKDSLGLGVGIGYTLNFSNPGSGATTLLIPSKSVYFPNHGLKTGDELIYSSNGGSTIQVSINGSSNFSLSNNTKLFVAKISDDIIGVSTVKVGIGSTGGFVGITSATKNSTTLYFSGIGTGTNHSFKTNYEKIYGTVSKNVVTVSTSSTHGLTTNDIVSIDVNPKTSTSVIVKYDDQKRRVIINPKNFISSGVSTLNSTITIDDHRFVTGQKIIYKTDTSTQNLTNNEIYYILVLDENTIKLCDSYYDSISPDPKTIKITSVSNGSISPINPLIKLYKESDVTFDLSDSSLAYTANNNQYSAFKFELYTDPYFKNVFNKTEEYEEFNIIQEGTVGISQNAKVILNIKSDFPDKLYYRLVPVFTDGIVYPENKREIIVDNLLIESNNTLDLLRSGYIGNYPVFVGVGSTSSFEYLLPNKPEVVSYSSTISSLSYSTNSISAFGPISEIKVVDPGKNYYSLPRISKINSINGKDALLEGFSESIGKIKGYKINNIGFDFSSDTTLVPKNYPILVVKLESLYSIDTITVSSFGINYNTPPKLLAIDSKTNEVIQDLDLEYSLNNTVVKIVKNTSTLSGLIPKIIPIENNNGFKINSIEFNSTTKLVTITFPYTGDFPFSLNDKILIENAKVSDSESKGYNSENYNYELFTIEQLTVDVGLGQGTLTYSLKDYLESGEDPGVFDNINSVGRIIPEKYFPSFTITLKRGQYLVGENIKSESSQEKEGYVSDWDEYSGLLTISNPTKEFQIGEVIQGESTGAKSKILNIYKTDSTTNISSKTKLNKGWKQNSGFLNDDIQKIQDSFYYQNFSYSIKSKVDYDTWKDSVLTLNHPKGFKVFSDYQLESTQYAGISTTKPSDLSVTLDIFSKSDFNTYYFDLSSENIFNIDSKLVSNEIIFKNKVVQDYILSFGNKVLSIDDISSQFDSSDNVSKKDFILTSNDYPIFKRVFKGNDQSIVDTTSDTIEIENHFFVTGEKISYFNGTNSVSNSIGIASTYFGVGIGTTNKLPNELYVVKIDDNKIKISRNAEDALNSTPKTLDITSVGIGTTHYFSCFNQNSRVLISIDGIIQSPITITSVKSSLSQNISISTDFVYATGISSFFNGDFIKIDDEIMKINSVGIGSTNLIKVDRSLLGTDPESHSQGSIITKIIGNYNINENTINFASPPLSLVDPLDAFLTQKSKFHGRSFIKSGNPDQNKDTYSNNYIFDDISDSFTGISSGFILKNNQTNVSGISTDNIMLLINNIPQIPSITTNEITLTNNYYLSEGSGVTTVFFVGSNNIPNQTDINTGNLPTKGVIVSVGSSDSLGYQPLVSAGGTVIVSISGTISSVSIGNSGSGYRSGIQSPIRVGVITQYEQDNKITYIGIATVSKGNIVGVSITNPGSGYSQSNPPILTIDDPLPYSNIPLIYSSQSSGIGTQAKIDVIVGNGSSIINFEIKNFGYNYKKGDILTIPIGGTIGIPTDTTKQFKEFNIFVEEIRSDKFSGWFIGGIKVLDNISGLFDGVRKRFPLSIGNQRYSLISNQGSKINLENNLLVFINDVLQVPGESYSFTKGDKIIFNEAPKGKSSDNVISGDTCKILFYTGNSVYDTNTVDAIETIKEGDELQLSYDIFSNQPQSLEQNKRTITTLYSNSAETELYFGEGISQDQTLYRPTFWRKQTEDKLIDFLIVSKNRVTYEPAIYPSAYIINSVGVNSTTVYVDNIRPFFNSPKESSTGNLNFQYEVTLLSNDTTEFARASSVVSSAGTVTSINITDAGSGYVSAPSVILESPVGLGTTFRASASSSINGGKISNITVTYGGSMYETTNPPQVLIEPPSIKKEKCIVSDYFGDHGIITGIATTSIVGVAVTGLVFDLFIPNNSYLRNSSISGTATTISGIKTGDYFVVYNSKVGNGVTSLNSTGSIVGVGTSRLDNVYIARSVSVGSSFVPSGGQSSVLKVVVSLASYNNLTGLGFSDFYGEYSWGKIDLQQRSSSNEYSSYRNNGIIGLSTSAVVIRSNPLRYVGYVT